MKESIDDEMRAYIKTKLSEMQASDEKANKIKELAGKRIHAFGDSIIAGHSYHQGVFDFLALENGMYLNKYAKNGATVLDIGYVGGTIISQISQESNETPDFVVFDGGTNDAEYLAINSEFEKFADEMRNLIDTLKGKWPESKLVYLSPHKMGSRSELIQKQINELMKRLCQSRDVTMVNIFEASGLDTSNPVHRIAYSFDENNIDGLPGYNGNGTHPNLLAISEFYLPLINDAFKEGKS